MIPNPPGFNALGIAPFAPYTAGLAGLVPQPTVEPAPIGILGSLGLISPFGLAIVEPIVPPVNDWDIYADIYQRLTNSKRFNVVALSDPPELKPQSNDRRQTATIFPGDADESTGFDEAYWSQYTRKVSWTLEIAVRDQEAAKRDARLIRLSQSVQRILDNQCLAGVTYVEHTKILRLQWMPAKPPERRLRLNGEFWYSVDNSYRDDALPY